MSQSYQEKRAEVLAKFPTVPSMSNYEMVVLLQKQFNHKENDTLTTNVTGIDSAMHLLREENRETNDDAARKDFDKFRDGIGDQVTIAHFIAFKLADLRDAEFPLLADAERPKNYTEYRENVNAKLEVLDLLVVGKKEVTEDNTLKITPPTATQEEKQAAFVEYMTALHSLPVESKIDIRADLIEITLSSLSKICKTEQVAQETLASYQAKGYIVHIEKSENGWIILVSQDCTVNDTFIPKGKFLKSNQWVEAVLPELNDTVAW